jgi:FMN-dependent NADH-azoreductase
MQQSSAILRHSVAYGEPLPLGERTAKEGNAMTNILVINSSAAREGSVSRGLVDLAVERLRETQPGAVIVERDLGSAPMPHLTSDNLAGVQGQPVTEAERAARVLSDKLIAELRAADIVVIGAPMYNFSIPSGLRSWFDYVLRAGETFSYSEAGPQGLLGGKRVIVIESRGGLYSEGPAKVMDFQEPYLRHLFGFIGITDVTFVHAEKLGFGPEAREQALAKARAQIDRVVGEESPRVAAA